MQTQRADTIKIRDVVMPPERELRLWMRRHIAEHNLPESALYLNVTGIYESSDKRGRWLHFKAQYSENWPGGSYAFTFKARPETPWQIVEASVNHVEQLAEALREIKRETNESRDFRAAAMCADIAHKALKAYEAARKALAAYESEAGK